MNVSWVFAVALALAGAANAGPISDTRVRERSEELHDVWTKFANLVPRKEFQEILEDYLVHDSGFNSAVEFFFSDAFKEAFRKIDSIDDVVGLYDYLEEAGLAAYQIVNELHVVVGLPPLRSGRQARSAKITGGSAGFIADYKALLPLDKIKALHEEQVKSSPAYARFVEYWKSPRFLAIIEALHANEEFQKQLRIVSEGGIHLWDIADLYATMFGLELPSRKVAKRSLDLDADLKEFRALVPEDEIMEIYKEYMKEDPESMFAYAYLRTPEYRDLIEKINSIDDVKKVYDYLQEAGLDARALVNLLSPQKLRRNSRSAKITGGPAGYIADIKAILPADKIQALHEEKLRTSPAFAKFVEYWKSPRFQKLLEALHSNREFQESIKFIKDAGVDLFAIADLYFASLGLRLPCSRRAVRSVDDDSLVSVMGEFGALLPTIERGKMLEDYLLTDEEFNRAVLYLNSPAFTKVVEKAEKIDDVMNVYNYLEDAGLPIHTLVNNLHDVVGLPHLKPNRQSRSVGITGGASGFIADYKALLPLDKIRALHEEKLRTSPAFARFVALWKSPRFQELIDALRTNQEFQELLKTAKEGGVDVVAFADLYATAMGLELPGSRVASKSSVDRSVGDVGFVFLEFLNLVPTAEYNAMMREYLRRDKEVKAALRFFMSDEFKGVVEKVDSMKDVITLYDYLQEAGLEIYSMANALHAIVDLPPLKPKTSTNSVKTTGGTAGLIADYKAILPIDKIKALHEERLKTSPAFARFVEYLKSPRFQEIIETLRANEELKEQLKIAKEGGIDVVAIVDLYATVMGIELHIGQFAAKSVAKRSVDDVGFVLIEFLNLIPTDKYNAMMREYLTNDGGLQAALNFFSSDTFKKVLEKVDSMKDVISLYDYLEEAGLEVYTMLNDLHAMVDLPPLKPGRSTRSVKITGGTAGLIADYKAILPIEKIKALHEERLKTSPAFARFVEYLKSPRFQEIIETLRANVELQEQLKIAKEGGIDVVAIADLYATAMGLELPISRVVKRSVDDLEDVLREFLNLVPEAEYTALLKEYLENDKELRANIQFFFSESFKDAFEKIENTKDVIGLYDYLEEAGLEIYRVIKDLHYLTGLPPPKPGRIARSVSITGGVSGLIADYKKLLPIDKIKALHEEMLKTSPAFARFVEYLKSPRFQEIIEALRANEELQKQLKIAEEGGIDVSAIADLGATLIGLDLPSRRVAKRSVGDVERVLREFLNLVPEAESSALLKEYLENDKEFQANIRFFFSDSFKDVIEKIENTKDVIGLYDYLEEAGMEIYSVIKDLHYLTGLPPPKPGRIARSVSITGGVSGLIADYKKLLPIDKIKALHEEMLKTSPAFARFVEYLKSPRFQEIIEALRVNEEFQKQLKIAKEGGIDVSAIADLGATLIGLDLPSRRVAKRSVGDVERVLREFLNLVPEAESSALLKEYLENDKEFQANIRFFFSDSFKVVIEKIENTKDVIGLYDYLEEAGMEIYSVIKDLHYLTGLPPPKPGRIARSVSITGGLSGLIADYKKLLPIDKIKALHEEMLKTSPAFARFVEYLKSPRFQEIIEALRANEELQKQLKIAKEGGIDVSAIADLGATLIGLELPSRRVAKRSVGDVERVLREFLNLVPEAESSALLKEYLENDKEFQANIRFFFSDSFKDVIEKIENTKDVIGLYDYLEEAGMEIYSVIKDLHYLTGLPPPKPGRIARSVSITGGLSGLIADYKKLLPIDKIKALHEEMLKTSPAFARFVEYLKSPRFQEIIEALRANEELQKQLKIAKEGGIDVSAIADLGATLIGLDLPSRRVAKRSVGDVERVLREFLNLVPEAESSALLKEYLENDKEFQANIRFFFSDSFKDVIEKIENTKDVIGLYDYLEEAGMEIYSVIKDLHYLTGLPPPKPERIAKSVSITGGLSGLIADYKKLLPIDKIKALHEEMLKTSPAFARFVEYLKSPRFQEIIEALRANEELQKQLKIAKEGGIDVSAIADFGATLIGLDLPSRRVAKRSAHDLQQDLNKFANLRPRKQLRKILDDYLAHDAGFNAAVEFFFSDDFKDALKKAESLDDLTNVFDYMEEAGLDVYDVLDLVHLLLDLPPLTKKSERHVRSVKITGGVDGYIADYRALLPVAKIKALHEKLVETSPAFARFVGYWKAPRFLELIDALRANDEFQKQLKIAKDGGVDVCAIADLYASTVGLEFPKIERA